MSEHADVDIQLELKDRLNYTQIIEGTIKSLKIALINPKTEFKTIQQLMLDFLTDIPDSWKDEDFQEEMKKVMKIRKIDVRPSFAGQKRSVESCKKLNISIIKEIKEINYFTLKNAIINLLDRRQMLIRREKIELTTGLNLDFETLDKLEESYEDEEVE